MRQYTAIYRRDSDENVWLVHIDEIPQVHTFGTSRSQAEDNIRDALALWLEVDPESLTIVSAGGADD